jgi:hypothetical protein
MPELKSRYIGDLKLEVTGSYMLGQGPLGRRRIDRLDHGSFKGPHVNADVLTGGMDLLLGGGDDALRPDVRVPLKLDDGEILLITYQGVRHGPPEVMQRIAKGEQVPHDAYYLRTAMRFETSSKTYNWLNRIVGVGVGRRGPTGVVYEVHEIL